MIAAILLMAAAPKPPVIDVVPVTPPPEEHLGDWRITFPSQGFAIAAVSNSAGATFGSICYKDGCSGFFNPSIKCDVGSKYPALVNAPASAFAVVLECEKVGDLLIYSLPIEGAVADAMSVGGVIGFAFPMASGEFKVARFSLTGAARAAARAQQYAQGGSPEAKQPASDNYAL